MITTLKSDEKNLPHTHSVVLPYSNDKIKKVVEQRKKRRLENKKKTRNKIK